MSSRLVFLLGAFVALGPVQSSAQHAAGGTEVQPYGVMFTLPAASTADGTLELELSTELTSERQFFVPTALKFTPGWQAPVLRHTEFGLSFDSIRSFPEGNHRQVRFGEAITLQLRKPLLHRGAYALAIGPWATVSTDGPGEGAGLRTMGSYARGRNHVYANLNLGAGSGHIHSRRELQADWFRALSDHGRLSRLHASLGAMYQRLSGLPGTFSVGEGLAYLVRPSLELDASWHQQHLNEHLEHQFWLGLTANVGQLHR